MILYMPPLLHSQVETLTPPVWERGTLIAER